ncbi:MAG: carboxymuconolactone decarboxylase family protein [Xanthobacter sp.]
MSESETFELPTYKAFVKGAPDVYASLAGLTKAVDATGLDKALTELVKVRVSQINGCVFCLKFHLDLARKAGVSQDKLDLLSVWPEVSLFSEREQAALAYAEGLTVLEGELAPEEDWEALRELFSHEEAVHLTVAIATINAWNRIGIGFNFAPPV